MLIVGTFQRSVPILHIWWATRSLARFRYGPFEGARRASLAVVPITRLNARLNAASESYPTLAATVATVWSVRWRRSSATCIRQFVT